MRLDEFLSSYGRNFGSVGDLKVFLVTKYGEKSAADEKFLEAETLLIFSSVKQRTWLVASARHLYCIFDLRTEDRPRVNWRIGKEKILTPERRIGVEIKVEDYSVLSGRVTIDGKKPRKFSKSLFTRLPIDQSIRLMLMKAFDVAL